MHQTPTALAFNARTVTIDSIVDSSYADIVEFIDGDLPDDPYFIVTVDDDVQAVAFEAYKLLHHYLAALYSFNERSVPSSPHIYRTMLHLHENSSLPIVPVRAANTFDG
jgi:hypothetical protein